MSIVAVISLITVLLICIIPWWNKRRRYMKHLERFPSPPRVFLFGNALDFKQPTKLIPKFSEYNRLYGDIVKIYVGPFPTKLLISNYKFVENILSSNKILNKGGEYKYLHKWLGDGLLLSKGDNRWKSHRKLLLPSFHVQIFQEFLDVFEANAQLLVKRLILQLNASSFDIKPYIQLCSLDIICEATMGTSIHAQENSDSDYVKSVTTMCQMFAKRAFNPILRNDFIYKFSKLYREEKRALKILHRYSTEVVERKKKELGKMTRDVHNLDEFGRKPKLTLLDIVLKRSNDVPTLTDSAIREEIDTFMFAGHDTTAAALTFAIFCLSENPEIQNSAFEEIKDIFSDDINRPVTLKDITEMRYLDAVIKETLRLYPPVPYYSRTVQKEFKFDGGIIPEGVSLLLNIYGLHRDPKFFPDPEKFRPERFLGDQVGKGFSYSYVPFSAGPRNCIGQKFAMLELKSVLSILLRHYKFLPSNPRHTPSLSTEIVLSSNNGVCIRISKRL